MKNLNRVTLIGRLTADPEKKELDSGKVMTQFSIATNYSWKDKEGEWKEGVDFHRVVTWGKQAGHVAEAYKKGDCVFVEGKLRAHAWVDGENNKRQTTEVVAKSVLSMASSAGKKAAAQEPEEVEHVEEVVATA